MKPWDLNDGVAFCRELNDILLPVGYSVGFTGSVLMKGSSRKDLDLLIYPLNTERQSHRTLELTLRDFGLRKQFSWDVVKARWLKLGSRDSKRVEVWEYEGKRVDLFFVS